MSGLPNLQKLVEQATASETQYHRHMESLEARLVLKDAAPALAELLIACEQALQAILTTHPSYLPTPTADVARAALARLSDYDKEIGQ